jgi:hypothetical protein
VSDTIVANAPGRPASTAKLGRPLTLAAAEQALRTARETLADLETRRSEVDARKSRLDGERHALSYDAMVKPGGAAATRLQLATVKSVEAGTELENLNSAIVAAKQHVLTAQDATASERRRQDARDARQKLAEMRAAGLAANAALDDFIAALGRFEKIGDALRHSGVPGMPSVSLARVATRRALDSMLMPIGLQSQLLGPSERRDLAGLVQVWAAQIEAQIGRILDEAA